MKKHVLFYSIRTAIISAILFCCFSATKAQDLTNTQWRCVGALQATLSAESIDSLTMYLSSNSEFALYCQINGQDSSYAGHWAQAGPSSFNYIDSIFSSTSFQSVCPTTGTTEVTYTISSDTLTMTSFHDTCQFIEALFTGSQWVDPALAVPTVQTADENIKIYPMPTTNILYIDTRTAFANSDKISITTYDITGRELNTVTTSKGHMQIDVSRLPAGMYLLQLLSDNGQAITKRFVVAR